MPDLSSTQIGSGFVPGIQSGSSLDTSSGGFDWGSIGKAGLPLALSLLAPKSQSITPTVNAIDKSAGDLKTAGTKATATGQEALSPALKYFQALVSGDPNAILQATAPDRARVIDQYDTARKNIAQFSPRGGGQSSNINEGFTKEASDLSTGTASARSNAATALASIGNAETEQGLTAEERSISALSATLQPLLQQGEQQNNSVISTFTGIGKLLGSVLFA